MLRVELLDADSINALTQDWQRQIKKGDYFVQMRETEDECEIFGKILHGYKDKDLKGFRYCQYFSIFSPEGKLGDIHVISIRHIITKKQFLDKILILKYDN